MTKEELDKIEQLGLIGVFMAKHLIDHHDFSEEKAKDFISVIGAKLHSIKKGEMEEMIEESFDRKK